MKNTYVAAILILAFAAKLDAHDTFLKFETNFLRPDTKATVTLMNGTFETSENSVALDRMRDVRITGPNKLLQRPKKDQWRLTEKLNELTFRTGATGTYGVGVSIKPRTLKMTAESFESYLNHDGVLDILEARRKGKQSEDEVNEKYSKHVKALFQVGEKRTDNITKPYGFPIEIVPQKNPFSLRVGDTLPVTVLFKGKPVRNQLVYANYAGFHRHDDSGQHIEAVKTRTNAKGAAQIKLSEKGRWYVRLIHMTPSDEEDIDYESNWATLTFEIK